MGEIVSTKIMNENTVVVEVQLDYEEAIALKGHMNNIHVFTEDLAEKSSQISTRGTNDATRYFLIPKELRDSLDVNSRVTCQRIETPTKTIFVYAVDKVNV